MSTYNKIGLAVFLAFGLAACGGGGGGSPSTAATPTATQSSNAAFRDATPTAGAQAASLDNASAGSAYNAAAYTINLDGKSYKVSDLASDKVTDIVNQEGNETVRAYRQQFSIIAGRFSSEKIGGENLKDDPEMTTEVAEMKNPMAVGLVNGEVTKTVPTSGKYAYNGAAFSESETGKLTYNVDFDKRVGSGSVTGLASSGKIDLLEASIKNTSFVNEDDTLVTTQGIEGHSNSEKLGQGDYRVHFFGQNAEEIGGAVIQKNGAIGIAGKR
ncbi:factor H binding family protein [Neisseria montereyensis]|uniref:Factor H binding family protein n=1 Tax=Neisseria montereyensis TaxID=2973938 RepID=A0ABT2FCZ3_9NEIS|nr:factor H binding family protein [Neisseria montereyensis]MCS4534099.1 factor H binding family protein [Neisseria montereyensis]